MATQYQSRTSTSRPEYLGTPALMAPSPITGNPVLATLAIHRLNDGTFAVVNGNAITVMDDGSIDAINATFGYQEIPADDLLGVLSRSQGTYEADVNCGRLFGVQGGRVVHLDPADAKAFGVDCTKTAHTMADGSKLELDGILAISAEAYLSLLELMLANAGKGIIPAPLTFRVPKTMDVFPFAEGLALAKQSQPPAIAEQTVQNRDGESLIIRAFPRGNQRSSAAAAKQAERIAASPLSGLNIGRKAPAPATPAQQSAAQGYAPRRSTNTGY